MKTPRKYKTLGLLDLYGFESLVEDPGGFEQLVFNFAAEKVQRVTLEWTMVLEQQEYAMEGVEWTHLNFLDNGQVVCLLKMYLSLLRNKKFLLKFLSQPNASKFAIFYI